jgi:ribonucleoside-diphosphate reductase alpha chain
MLDDHRTQMKREKDEAIGRGYEGEHCHHCGHFTVVRNGTYMKCDSCGEESGKTVSTNKGLK